MTTFLFKLCCLLKHFKITIFITKITIRFFPPNLCESRRVWEASHPFLTNQKCSLFWLSIIFNQSRLYKTRECCSMGEVWLVNNAVTTPSGCKLHLSPLAEIQNKSIIFCKEYMHAQLP